jgi:ABC-type transport system involved in cytochrome c biogenesis permease subunit
VARIICPDCKYDEFEGNTCKRCGRVISAYDLELRNASLGARILARLGRPTAPTYRANMPWRRPLLVALMSAVVIGSGHLYCEDYKEGTTLPGAAVVLTLAVVYVSPWALFLLAVIWNYQIFSAYDRAVEFDWSSIYEADERE